MSQFNRENTIFLFDVDGTLSASRCKASKEMLDMLHRLRKIVKIGFVGGSDIDKQIEQIGDNCLELFDYGFPENGVCFYKNGKLVSHESMRDFMGKELYEEFVEFCRDYTGKLDVPVKTSNFVECRNSMVNVSPVGRNCTPEQRKDFFMLDKEKKYRVKMVSVMQDKFGDKNIDFVIGGQISIDCFPRGWDKRYCLKHLEDENMKHIIFFGDMTSPGGNDYEIYKDERVNGITVLNPQDTMVKINEELKKLGLPEV